MKTRHSSLVTRYLYLVTSYLLLVYLPSEASGAIVGEIEVHGLYSIEKKELLDLLDIGPDKPLDSIGIRQGIKRAFLKGIFEDISFEITDGEKAKVIIRIRERDFIQKISIDGHVNLSQKIVKKLLPLKEGQLMRYDLIENAKEKLRSEMEIRGFPYTAIHIEIERLKEPYRVQIHIHIDTGDPERIKNIQIHGAPEEIKDIMRLSDGDIYDQVTLGKDIERIKTYYKRNGYFKPVVGPYTYTEGTLDIFVNIGKRLKILIEGNRAISTKNLLKEMPFFETEDFRDELVEEAVQRILSLYHKGGYPFAQIAPVVTSGDEETDVNFFIFEGTEVKLRSISFRGVSLPENNLKEIMSLKERDFYNPDLIEGDTEEIEGFYNALGYLNAQVEEFQTNPPLPPLLKGGEGGFPNEMDIVIKVNEGLRTIIERVDIVEAHLVPEAEIRKVIGIKPGDIYNVVDISDERHRIIELYTTRGFTEAKVLTESKIENQKALITFRIDEGTEIVFGKTIITGNYKTGYKVITRELQYREGSPLNYHLIGKSRQRLYRLGLFTDVDMEVLDRYDSKKDILMNVKEGNAGVVELGLGYADYERFRGFFDLSYRNLWGMNKQASFRFEMSSIERRYILQYHEPWFLDLPLSFRTFLIREERKEINIDTRETRYRLTRHGVNAGVEKRLSDIVKMEFYYEFSLVETFDVKPDVILSREDTGTLTISGIRPGIVYDTRDNPFNPRKGILSGISVKLTSPVFLSETNFIKLIFHGSAYQELIRGIVIAISVRGGAAQGYHKTDELPLFERFFLGGRMTVRGYEQDTLGPEGSDGNPTGGNAFLMGNVEIRSSLGKGIGIAAFLDGGNVWIKAKDINPGDFKYTTGLGLRYNTPVGPIRLDYGHKLHREEGKSRGELHFSIGHTF